MHAAHAELASLLELTPKDSGDQVNTREGD